MGSLFRSWEERRSERTNRTFEALQNLRMNETYLKAARDITNYIAEHRDGLTEADINELMRPASHVVGESAGISATFILNQYEFFAVGVRGRALDETYVRSTIRSAVCDITKSLAPFIKSARAENPNIWENLIWLYLRFAADRPRDWPDLGPPIRR